MPPPRQGQLPAANKIFVDRGVPQRVFENAAFSIPLDRSILLVFYGVGGQGKTVLCHELIRKTNEHVDPSYRFLRRAQLDLHDHRKEDADRLLVRIRNGFADAGVAFPCFDLAFAIAWEATRSEEPLPKFTKPWLGRTTAAAEGGIEDWIGSDHTKELIGDLASSIPGVGFILKRVGHWAIEKGKRVYLEQTQDALRELYIHGEIKKPFELSPLLPWMLAQDLNNHLKTHLTDRFVLFIDEYESVFDEGGAGSNWEENLFDSHMRKLITETNGLLGVFFSREQLPWSADPDWRDLLKNTQHLLGGLADKDADTFLTAIPIEDKVIRQAIISGARETSQPNAPVYPLMLDLQVEHWRSLMALKATLSPERFRLTADSFESRRREIVTRVLRDYGTPLETTLERLSVIRQFDRQAFTHIVKTFGTALPLDQFDRILDLSFASKNTNGFVTIHNSIAEAIRETLTPYKRITSVEALFRHFEKRVAITSSREVTEKIIIALNEAAFLRLTQTAEGYVKWLEHASRAIEDAARYAPVTALWREAVIATETQLGPEHPDTATSLNNLAYLLQAQGDLAAAKPLFERALALCEKALGPEHPNTATSLNNLAYLLRAQGDLATAKPLFGRALAVREKALGPERTGVNGRPERRGADYSPNRRRSRKSVPRSGERSQD
jgi:tetratricopeptide (TPR) repeat protein